jgi:pimeloyl-ACP methyl ester carboxylesterase
MKTKAFRITAIVLLVLLLLLLVTAIAGAMAKSNLAQQYPAPGQLVDVGGYKLHLNCMGQGSPTIILAAGMGDFSVSWADVQPEVAKFARVCSYDRAGLGWSESSSHPQTASTMVEDLHTLLVNANVQGPYVLVGHSLGGMLTRVYANNYPKDLVGMVLVDALHEERLARLPALMTKETQDALGQFRMLGLLNATGIMALAPQSIPSMGLRDEAYAQWQAILATTGYWETTIDDLSAMAESLAEVRALHITNLGNLPLRVLSPGRWEVNPSLSDAEDQQIQKEFQAEQAELTALSSDGKQIIVDQSSHFIQREQPDLVIDAIRQVMEANH